MSFCEFVSVTDVASSMFCDHTHPSSSLRNNDDDGDGDGDDDAHLLVGSATEIGFQWDSRKLGWERPRHISQECPRLRHLFCAFMLAAAQAANETGTARRRQRRATQWLRHECLSVAMALAETNHHTAPRDRPRQGPGSGGASRTSRRRSRRPLLPSPSSSTSLMKSPGGGSSRQSRVLWHTVEHIIDVLPSVQILDVLVPQMGDLLVEFMKMHDTQSPAEQVTAVPKISSNRTRNVLWTGAVRRGRNSWWNCRHSLLMSSRSLTFQFPVVGASSLRFSPRTEFNSVECRADR